MLEVLIVGIGGFIGANLRFALTKIIPNINFPYATLVANVVAAVVIGFILGLNNTSYDIKPRTRLLINTGILGGLSTFSTFSLETINLFNESRILDGILNIGLNLSLSLIGVLVGYSIAKILVRNI